MEDEAPASAPPFIVTLPSEIDMSNTEQVGDHLRECFDAGARVVIADMTATSFCDSAGVRMLLRAQQHATASNAELRLVATPGGLVRRVVELMGLVGILSIYPTIAAAAGDGA